MAAGDEIVLMDIDNATSSNLTLWNMSAVSPVRSGGCGGLEWHLYLEMICVPLFTALGLVGNTISFLVLFSPVYCRKSYSYYLRALAVFDSLTLIITLVITYNDVVFQLSGHKLLVSHTVITCKLSEFLRHVIYVTSSWLVVCFTLDRYVAVCHPLQRARLCTQTGAITTVALVFLGACLSQLYILVYVTKIDRNNAMECHAEPEDRVIYMGLQYFLFSFTLRFMLPFIVIVIFNGLIIVHIQRMRHNPISRERDKTRNANMAIYTLFVVCVVFVVTLMPNAVITLTQLVSYWMNRATYLYCALKTVNTPFKMVRLINYSTNFFLYGIGGRLFRREVRRLLCCELRGRELNGRTRDRNNIQLNPAHNSRQSRLAIQAL